MNLLTPESDQQYYGAGRREWQDQCRAQQQGQQLSQGLQVLLIQVVAAGVRRNLKASLVRHTDSVPVVHNQGIVRAVAGTCAPHIAGEPN